LVLDQGIHSTFNKASVISKKYFSWVHLWMPILSKSKWKHLTGSLAQPAPDVKILLFAMKTLLWTPSERVTSRQPRNKDYAELKKHLSRAEAAGSLSLELLQAWILTTIYEFAHGIYPAAYLSIGTCARYGMALGLDIQDCASGQISVASDIQEEKRRAWWSIIILHRVISPASDGPDPRPGDLLPVHDQDWDDGKFNQGANQPVSAPSSTDMGMLARLAQSAFLLGRVYKWKTQPTGDVRVRLSDKLQLDGKLHALLNLTHEEGNTRFMAICPQTALYFSALALLHSDDSVPRSLPITNKVLFMSNDQYSNHEGETGKTAIQRLQFLHQIANESCTGLSRFFRKDQWAFEKSSPLLLHWTYVIAMAYLQIGNCLRGFQKFSVAGDEFTQYIAGYVQEADLGVQMMKRKFTLLGYHWSAAETYLKIIQAREAENSPQV